MSVFLGQIFELQGEWWLPENPSQKVKGALRFTPKEGGILRLDVFPSGSVEIEHFQQPQIILGVSIDGRKVTLHTCLMKEMVKHALADGTQTTVLTLYVGVILVGAQFKKIEDAKFDSMFIRFQHLDAWVNVSGFNIDVSADGISVKYQRPKDYVFEVSEKLKLHISYAVHYPTISTIQNEACITQEAWIGIIPSEPKPLDYYWDIIYSLQNFLILATTATVYPLSVSGRIKVKDQPNISVDIYRSIGSIESSESLHPSDMLFTFNNVSEQLHTLMANWFAKSDTLKPFYDLYFGTYYVSEMYLTTEFLNYVQALESYHRRTKSNVEIPEDQHRKRFETVVTGAPPEYKEWLVEKLRYSNEPNLRKRLKEILKSFPASLEPVLKDRRKFVNDVCVTRNYLTHYDSELEHQAAKDRELFALTSRVKLLLQFCMLKELGFDPQNVEKLTARLINMRYGFLYH